MGQHQRRAKETGVAFSVENMLVPLKTGDRWEERYWTLSYSPLIDSNGQVMKTLFTITNTKLLPQNYWETTLKSRRNFMLCWFSLFMRLDSLFFIAELKCLVFINFLISYYCTNFCLETFGHIHVDHVFIF